MIIVEAGTGNGKSVLIPKYALHVLDYKGRVVITNPKQIPTRENAQFAAKCLDVSLGKEVGFQYQGSKLENGRKSKSDLTKLLFSTDGSVVEVLRKDPTASQYDIVIIDEAHERNLRIDMLLLLLKRALKLNPDLKLIIMSATLPGNLFYDYYSDFQIEKLEYAAIPNKPVEIFYLEEPTTVGKYIEVGIEIIIEEIVEKNLEGDILMFVTDGTEARQTCRKLDKIFEKMKRKIKCYPLSRQVKDEKIKELAISENKFREEPGGPWERKIVVGTNLVESSITVDGIVFCY